MNRRAMSRHVTETDLALYAAGDLPFWRGARGAVFMCGDATNAAGWWKRCARTGKNCAGRLMTCRAKRRLGSAGGGDDREYSRRSGRR